MVAVDAHSDLRTSLEAYLAVADEHLTLYEVPVDRLVISPSPVTWDGGCDGQLWVRIVSIVPTVLEPTAQLCGVNHWTATLGLGVIRKISSVSNNGAPPYPEDVTADALKQAEDTRILKNAIMTLDTTRTFTAWNPLQQQGGFAGGEWTFTIRYPNIYKKPPEPPTPTPEVT